MPRWIQGWRRTFVLGVSIASAVLGPGRSPAFAQGVSVLTRGYNNQRTGANVSETSLTPSNVTSGQFSKLFALPVDDQVYAGILYVSGLSIAGGIHNVIYVATTNNSVYAFDADTLGPPLWSRNFNGIGQPSNSTALGPPGYADFRGHVGIVGTPVIDGSSGTMYFVTRTVENGNTVQRLRAIDITTGIERPNSPQIIQGSVPGNGDGGLKIVFNAAQQNQRPALALSQGVIYIAWASYGDQMPYHGWVMTYDENTLAPLTAMSVTPNGNVGGIWMAGAGPAFDANGNAYFPTGNGDFDGATNFGESLMKLAPNSLGVVDYFAPSDYTTLNAQDLDFGSAGPTILPGTNLIIQGGKEGKLYLLNMGNLGHEASGDTQIPQVFQAVDVTVRPNATHHIHNSSPAWNSPEGLKVFVWGENDFLHAYLFNTSSQVLNTTPFATGSVLPPIGMPGGMMTVSANGSQSGIVWATLPRAGDANEFTVPGNLYAFNAESLALLWASTGTGDDLLDFSKGSAPIVANGKVYAGSLSKFATVYGPSSAAAPSQDLALNKIATSSTACNVSQTAAQAVNGSFSGGLNDKWCSSVPNPWMMVDLGATYNISRFVVEHAGAGGEGFALNTSAYNIQVSTDGVNFSTVINVSGNVDSITTNDIPPTMARFVQLNIVSPVQPGQSDSSARIYEFQVFGAVIPGPSADFSVSTTPPSLSVVPGFDVTSTVGIIAMSGFSDTVTLSASGLPSGATASFSPPSVAGMGNSILTIFTIASTPPGTYTITVTATAGGGSQHATTFTLIVNAPSPTGSPVNLSSVFNKIGIVNDGSTFSTGGMDGGGNALSANLLGSTLTFQGTSYTMGPPNQPNVVSSQTIPLPPCACATLGMLATAVGGSQVSQIFAVNYTDGTKTSFTRSLSDWHAPQNFAGEGQAANMAYRDRADGTESAGPFFAYSYSFALDSTKTVSSISMPNISNVIALAFTLTPPTSATPDFSIGATGSQMVTVGGTGNYTATLTALNGFSGTIALSATGLPTGTTAGFNPASVNGSGTSAVTLSTTSSTPTGTYTVTLTGTSGALIHSTNLTLIVNAAPNFSISATGSQTVTVGGTGNYTATLTALNGFTGTIALSATGLPTGTTAGFNPTSVNGAGTSAVTLSTTSSTPTGTYTVTLTGTSGALVHSTSLTLIVNPVGSTSSQVNLSSVFNKIGIVTDGSTFNTGGMDGGGNAYSANLLGSSVSYLGTSFSIGPANAPNVVSSVTIPLPAGQYSTLGMLASAVGGNQLSQPFKVNYTDGTSSSFSQSISDWHTPQSYPGEGIAVLMAYRDVANGTADARPFYLYGYSFALDSSKTVTSLTMPNLPNDIAIAFTLTP